VEVAEFPLTFLLSGSSSEVISRVLGNLEAGTYAMFQEEEKVICDVGKVGNGMR
jgi:hypothetical protein